MTRRRLLHLWCRRTLAALALCALCDRIAQRLNAFRVLESAEIAERLAVDHRAEDAPHVLAAVRLGQRSTHDKPTRHGMAA